MITNGADTKKSVLYPLLQDLVLHRDQGEKMVVGHNNFLFAPQHASFLRQSVCLPAHDSVAKCPITETIKGFFAQLFLAYAFHSKPMQPTYLGSITNLIGS
jgi:hypothetical protein